MRTIICSAGPQACQRSVSGRPKGLHYICAVAVAVFFAANALAATGNPALIDAAERGDHASALRLLSKGADPNAVGPDGTTAIMWAASNDDVELVRALIKAGANVKGKNQFGTSALSEAAIV